MNKKKKTAMICGIITVLIVAMLFVFLKSSEDSWIKDSRGVWIKHGNPSATPDYVAEQQGEINCAYDLYAILVNAKQEIPNSQCLGSCGIYAVDIVHVPRVADDDLAENQCEDFSSGKLKNFIELNMAGEVARIV